MPNLLSEEDRTAFANRLCEYVVAADIKRSVVILHGGEPLLAGADSIVRFARLLRSTVPKSFVVDIGLQTNGLLLTEAVAAEFQREDIHVSLSLDGPREANDLHRTTRKGRSSFNRVANALEVLKTRPAIFDGVIAVIDPKISPRTLFEYFAAHGLPKLDFLLPDAHHLHQPPARFVNPDVYLNWLIEAFDIWLSDFPNVPMRTFESLLDSLAGLDSGTDAFGYGDVSLITVETDGSYHDLDVLKVAYDGATRLFGTVRETAIAEVAASTSIATHQAYLKKNGLCAQCQRCPVVNVCGGGSLPHRYGTNGFDNPTVYCREMLGLISHAKAKVQALLTVDVIPNSEISIGFDGNIENFELAERAVDIMSLLWRRATQANLQGFTEAVQFVRQKQPHFGEDGNFLLNNDITWVEALVNRPGSVAWYRTILSTENGRRLHSVDGTPLVADGDYLRYLREEANLKDGISVATVDPWLRRPFGNSIVFEGERVTSLARPLVNQAIEIISKWRPALAKELHKTSGTVQFIRDLSAHQDKIVSFSDNEVPGALYMSVVQGGNLIDAYDLADSLIHEHRHQKLYLLERLAPTVKPTTMKVISPWREDLRPPSGLLHAAFVFVELRRFWLFVRDLGPPRLRNRALDQLAATDANLSAAFQTLNDCPLTETGRSLVAALSAAHRIDLVPA